MKIQLQSFWINTDDIAKMEAKKGKSGKTYLVIMANGDSIPVDKEIYERVYGIRYPEK